MTKKGRQKFWKIELKFVQLSKTLFIKKILIFVRNLAPLLKVWIR